MNQLAVLLLFSVCLFSCIQTKNLVKKTYAYYTEKQPGTIPADDNGIPLPVKPDTVLVVYVEAKSDGIRWDTAWHNGKPYKIIPQFFETGYYDAGIEKLSREKVLITVDPPHFLYQLYLEPIRQTQGLSVPESNSDILLKGIYKGKVILHKASRLVELEAYPSV